MVMIVLSLLLLIDSINSYMNSNRIIRSSFMSMSMPSYKDAFNRAKNPQLNTNNKQQQPQKQQPVEAKQQRQINKREQEEIMDDLPFTDDMYDHLKYVIGSLTARMKSEKPLTSDQMKRFKDSIDAIILDSKDDDDDNSQNNNFDDDSSNSFYSDDEEIDNSNNYEAEEPVTNAITYTQKAAAAKDLEGNPFTQFRGSTWNFDNMEDMSTVEYYDALNKRLADMKQKKLEAYERDELNNPSESYFDTLAKKNRN